MTTQKSCLLFWVIIPMLLSAACTGGSSGQRTLLLQSAEAYVPQDADKKIVAPNLPWVQISFEVRRPWLQFAVDERRIFQARMEGWALCQAVGPQWDGYQDYAVTPPRYRRVRAYVLYKAGVVLTLMGIYDSPIAESPRGNDDEKPIQQGVVIARRATEKEAIEAAANLRLACNTRAPIDGLSGAAKSE